MPVAKTKLDRLNDERQRKSRQIKQASLELFAEKGYAGTSIDDISKRLGYGKASLYYYFNSKEEIFVSLVFDGISKLIDDMDDMEKSPEKAVLTLGRIVDYFVEEKFKQEGFFRIFHQIQTFFTEVDDHGSRLQLYKKLGHIMDGITNLVERAIKEGDVFQTDARVLAGIFLGLVFGTTFFAGGLVIPVHSQQEFKELVRAVILNGLLPIAHNSGLTKKELPL